MALILTDHVPFLPHEFDGGICIYCGKAIEVSGFHVSQTSPSQCSWRRMFSTYDRPVKL